MSPKDIFIDLSDIQFEDIEVLSQQGVRGIPEFAASTDKCNENCSTGCSTSVEDPANAK